MGALPNSTPRPVRKPVTKAAKASKKNQYGRYVDSPSEKMRVSDYDQKDYAPYAPVPMSFFADLPRLSSGNSCTWLCFTAWAKGPGRGMQKGSARPEWTLALATEDLAQICCCDVRTIEREAVALEKRGMAEILRSGQMHPETKKFLQKGEIAIRLKYREWESLPNYKSDVVEMPVSDEAGPDIESTDESKPGTQRVTGKRPVRLAAGATSKAYEVKVGVKEYQARVEGPVDCEVSAVIQAGRFVTVVRFPDDWREKVLSEKSTPNDSNGLDGAARHGRREDVGGKAGDNAATRTRRSDVESGPRHPRADELKAIFDPLLGKSGAVLLAMDPISLRSACEAIQDCDHSYLVKFAEQRGAAPIRKPSHVKLICQEALNSWKASKLLDGAGLPADKSPLTEKGKRVAENLRRIHGK